MPDGFGALGKLPALGDFLRLNLSPEFSRTWDEWLQGAILTTREALGARWDDCYLSAPIWRFSLPEGAAGPAPISGILMASVDRVGRQYPLTLVAPAPPGDTALRHFANDVAFAALEEIALAALEHDTGRDDLARALAAVTLAAPVPIETPISAYRGAVSPAAFLAAQRLEQVAGGGAVWTAVLHGDHRMLLTRGLPDTGEALALFDLDARTWQPRPQESFV